MKTKIEGEEEGEKQKFDDSFYLIIHANLIFYLCLCLLFFNSVMISLNLIKFFIVVVIFLRATNLSIFLQKQKQYKERNSSSFFSLTF